MEVQFKTYICFCFVLCRDGRQLYDLLSKTTDVSFVTVNLNYICSVTDNTCLCV